MADSVDGQREPPPTLAASSFAGMDTARDPSFLQSPITGYNVALDELVAYNLLCRELEARQWVEDVLGYSLDPDLMTALRDGTVLCDLGNAIPLIEPIPRIHRDTREPFRCMENITSFIDRMRQMGFPESLVFEAPDVFYNKAVVKVVNAIHFLARHVVQSGETAIPPLRYQRGDAAFNPSLLAAAKNKVPSSLQTIPTSGARRTRPWPTAGGAATTSTEAASLMASSATPPTEPLAAGVRRVGEDHTGNQASAGLSQSPPPTNAPAFIRDHAAFAQEIAEWRARITQSVARPTSRRHTALGLRPRRVRPKSVAGLPSVDDGSAGNDPVPSGAPGSAAGGDTDASGGDMSRSQSTRLPGWLQMARLRLKKTGSLEKLRREGLPGYDEPAVVDPDDVVVAPAMAGGAVDGTHDAPVLVPVTGQQLSGGSGEDTTTTGSDQSGAESTKGGGSRKDSGHGSSGGEATRVSLQRSNSFSGEHFANSREMLQRRGVVRRLGTRRGSNTNSSFSEQITDFVVNNPIRGAFALPRPPLGPGLDRTAMGRRPGGTRHTHHNPQTYAHDPRRGTVVYGVLRGRCLASAGMHPGGARCECDLYRTVPPSVVAYLRAAHPDLDVSDIVGGPCSNCSHYPTAHANLGEMAHLLATTGDGAVPSDEVRRDALYRDQHVPAAVPGGDGGGRGTARSPPDDRAEVGREPRRPPKQRLLAPGFDVAPAAATGIGGGEAAQDGSGDDAMGGVAFGTDFASSFANESWWTINYDDIAFGDRIGGGGFGSVYKGSLWGKEVAVKKVRTHRQWTVEALTEFYSEVQMMSLLRHPNIILFIGACFDPMNLCIVSELLLMALHTILHDPTRSVLLDWGQRIRFALDIALGMNYLHRMGILHCDLKTRNLLVDKDFNIKVADFGLSQLKNVSGGDLTLQVGTYPYMAPEVFESGSEYTEKSDVYSYGIVLWEILTEEEPFAEKFDGSSIQRAVTILDERPRIPEYAPPSYRKLIEKCWRWNPDHRPAFADIAVELRSASFTEKDKNSIIDFLFRLNRQSASPRKHSAPF